MEYFLESKGAKVLEHRYDWAMFPRKIDNHILDLKFNFKCDLLVLYFLVYFVEGLTT